MICQIDNVEPHEHHFIDRPFNRYFLRAVDGFVYMSEQVHRELEAYTAAPALFSPHPLFENFGERVDRREACVRLGLDPACRYVLFFGLVRDYKGLDLLLDAWALLRRAGRTAGRRLIVAGEFYTSKEPYLRQIAANGLADEVILHDYFIPDERVKYYFSAADFVVQPYKTATQSGVTQIAYQFCVPMVVTRVGGLAEIVPDGRVGYVCEPTAQGVADAIERMYADGVLGRFRENCVEERRRFSWEEMCSRIVEVYRLAADRSRGRGLPPHAAPAAKQRRCVPKSTPPCRIGSLWRACLSLHVRQFESVILLAVLDLEVEAEDEGQHAEGREDNHRHGIAARGVEHHADEQRAQANRPMF